MIWNHTDQKNMLQQEIVEELVIVELEAAECPRNGHEWQPINYPRATDIKEGLLLNFGKKPEFRGKIVTYDRKKRE